MNKIESVCVYCGSSQQADEIYYQAAHELGALLSSEKIELIYGGGNVGVMGAISTAVLEHKGKVTGVIPRFMVDQGWVHQDVEHMIVVESMHERKAKMAALSKGVIAMPGGCGTLEELLEIITWKQLGLYLHPIIILNTNNYFDFLLKQLQEGVNHHFMRPMHLDMWHVASTPKEAIELLRTTPQWDSNVRKLAQL